jgi:hypothetical protein
MKRALLIFLSMMSLTSAQAFGRDLMRTRIFTINWDAKHPADGDVQMCDDNYYNKLEILVPVGEFKAAEYKAVFEKACPGMKVKWVESVNDSVEYFIRYEITDAWDSCTIEFVEPKSEGRETQRVYTVELGDGC